MGNIHWINADGTERIEASAQGPSFDAMKEFLGGHSEHVSVLYQGYPASMFVHEFGRIQGLPRNKVATEIYFAASRSRGIDPVAEFEKKGTTNPTEIPEGFDSIINLDPTPNEPPGIHGPAILLENFPI